jgi:4,5-DOPA dioxygenase extradiol
MDRLSFLKLLGLSPLAMNSMRLKDLEKLSNQFSDTELMPLLFLGHGSPMNAIEDNEFVQGFREIAKTLPKPQAILCISAHWFTRGIKVTAMPMPKTIHDFGGFPETLYNEK